MSEAQLDQLMAKVKKLLALADPSRGATEAEAETAMRQAQALLARHNLTMSQVQEHQSPDQLSKKVDTGGHIIHTTEIMFHRWAPRVAQAAARLYFCDYWFTRSLRTTPSGSRVWDRIIHTFVGKAHNIAVASSMADYLLKAGVQLSKEAGRKSGLTGRQRYAYERDFRDGFAGRLGRRVDEIIAAAKRGQAGDGSTLPALRSLYENELALVSEFMKDKKLREAKTRGVRYTEGYRAGAAAADKVGLNSQVGGGAAPVRSITGRN